MIKRSKEKENTEQNLLEQSIPNENEHNQEYINIYWDEWRDENLKK
ncbi:hypothetical protein ACJ2A9_04020 [Anaerobacillus sp. MEB173]